MRVRYDPDADAAYIYLADIPPGGVALTVPGEDEASGVNLDFDSEGRLVGIEIISARSMLPREFLSWLGKDS